MTRHRPSLAHDSTPLVMLMMTWQPYFFELAVSSFPRMPYLRVEYSKRIVTVDRIVLLCKK